ncbi:MAG: tetratricopeptide repeat protein [Armatimonadota bacterium]
MSQGDLSGAREQLAKAAALEPEDADTLAFYGECLVRSGMVAEANKTLSRALSLKPMHAHANLWMANWHAAQGQRDAAVRYAQIARDSAARNYW